MHDRFCAVGKQLEHIQDLAFAIIGCVADAQAALLTGANTDTLIVCGVTTEVCVHTTIREANDRGYHCVALADACASYFPEFHRVGLEMIKAQGGIFGWVSSSAAFAAALDTAASSA